MSSNSPSLDFQRLSECHRNSIFDTTIVSGSAFPFLRKFAHTMRRADSGTRPLTHLLLAVKKSSASTGEPKPVTVNYVRFSISPDAMSEKVEDPGTENPEELYARQVLALTPA